jgi:hypothetical protein
LLLFTSFGSLLGGLTTLIGSTLLSDVIRGVQFVDGIKKEAA